MKKIILGALFTLLGIGSLFVYERNKELLYSSKSKEYFFHEQIKREDNVFYLVFNSMGQHIASALGIHKEVILLPIPFKRQENALTCEIASLRMALSYVGVEVTEKELVDRIAYSATTSKSHLNVWGDPQKGFVGDVNGSVMLGTGYGVYNKPIRDLALNYHHAEIMEEPTIENLLTNTQQGRPVIVWGISKSRTPIYWFSYEGDLIKAWRGEHARVVMGYVGTMTNPTHIVLMDPLYGKVKINTAQFIEDWARLDYMAVVVG